MHIDELLTLPADKMSVPDNWSQGRTVFGGLSCGLVYNQLRKIVEPDRVLRALTANFVGPLFTDKDFEIVITTLSSGKNVTQVLGQAIQDGKVCLSVQAALGVARSSNIIIDAPNRHPVSPPKEGAFIPMIPGITPNFLEHISFSINEGQLPFSGAQSSHYDGWMRFKQTPQQLTDTHLITLIDAWPPTVLQLMKQPAPASTMSWNIEFIHPHPDFQSTEWLGYEARTRQAGTGYAHVEADIYSESGSLVALSRQVVTVFD